MRLTAISAHIIYRHNDCYHTQYTGYANKVVKQGWEGKFGESSRRVLFKVSERFSSKVAGDSDLSL